MQGNNTIRTCGLCSVVSGLLRRAVCIGSRRDSNESYYRELGNQDTAKIEDKSSEVSSNDSEDAITLCGESIIGEREPVLQQPALVISERSAKDTAQASPARVISETVSTQTDEKQLRKEINFKQVSEDIESDSVFKMDGNSHSKKPLQNIPREESGRGSDIDNWDRHGGHSRSNLPPAADFSPSRYGGVSTSTITRSPRRQLPQPGQRSGSNDQTPPQARNSTGAIPKQRLPSASRVPTRTIRTNEATLPRSPDFSPRWTPVSSPKRQTPKVMEVYPKSMAGMKPARILPQPRQPPPLPPRRHRFDTFDVPSRPESPVRRNVPRPRNEAFEDQAIARDPASNENAATVAEDGKDNNKASTEDPEKLPKGWKYVYIGCNSTVILLDPNNRSEPFNGFFTVRRVKKKPGDRISLHPERLLTEFLPQHVHDYLERNADEWSFNPFHFDKLCGGHGLPSLCLYLFEVHGLIKHFHFDIMKCWTLFNMFEEGYYGTNPYHNSIHATDVTQAIHCFLMQDAIHDFLEPVEIMCCILAAIAHDIFHPGVNHVFLTNTFHQLPVIYKILERPPEKSRSILENHHWRSALSCVIQSGLLDGMPDVLDQLRRHLKLLIMATDVTCQDQYLNRFRGLLNTNTLNMNNGDHRILALQIALKCADISNPCRPWFISQRWSIRVCEEFFRQGDYERTLKLPITQLCDRELTSMPAIQIGFFQFIVEPLVFEWDRFLNSALSNKMRINLSFNETQWGLLLLEEDQRKARLSINEVDERVESIRPLSDVAHRITAADVRRRASAESGVTTARTEQRRVSAPNPVGPIPSTSRGMTSCQELLETPVVMDLKPPSAENLPEVLPTDQPVFLKCTPKAVKKQRALESESDVEYQTANTIPRRASAQEESPKSGIYFRRSSAQEESPRAGMSYRRGFSQEETPKPIVFHQRSSAQESPKVQTYRRSSAQEEIHRASSPYRRSSAQEEYGSPRPASPYRRSSAQEGSSRPILSYRRSSAQEEISRALFYRRGSAQDEPPMEFIAQRRSSAQDDLPRAVIAQRRGSAPAPICPELRSRSRRRASPVGTCQQWLARAMPRRSSLPVEVMTGISSR